jgi:hypothetical protein
VKLASRPSPDEHKALAKPVQLLPLGPREFQIRCWKGMQVEVRKSDDPQN